jgi:acetolactate synthase-1/2/3 large subunit
VKLSDYVADFVAQQGVNHVFMLPGGGAMHLNESFGSNPKLAYVCNLHEQACAVSAEAYGQFTNNLGVVQVTTGPGGTNTLTGVAAAYLDSTPLLVISGQVKTQDLKGSRAVRQLGFQEIDVVAMARPITKYAVTVLDSKTIRFELEKAVHLARSGRPGPVWVDIPLDVQAANVDPAELPRFTPEDGSEPCIDQEVRKCLELLANCNKPVILAGNGIRLSGAVEQFVNLVELLRVPTLLTWKSADFLHEDHPCYCGRPGGTGQRGANFTQQGADLLLIIGARLDAGQTAYNHANFAPKARKIMVDIDPAEIEKMQMKLDVAAACDAGRFIEALSAAVSSCDLPKQGWVGWLADSKSLHESYPLCLPEYWKRTDYVDNYVFIDVLSGALAAGDLIVPGSSGQCSEITMQAFKLKRGQRMLNSEGLGPMGFGIAAPIGACLASGRKRTVSIDGDGGFILNIQELETLRRLNLPVKIFVLNNNGYGSIRSSQRNYFGGHYVASDPESGVTLPQWKGVVESYGLPFFRADSHDNIRNVVAEVLGSPGPAVCEVMVAPDQATMPRVTSKQLSDGRFVTAPMEEMWPNLS